jgi:outer membrane protein TolC
VVDVTQRARETAQAHYDYSHTRYAGGVGNRVDEVRAEQELHAHEAQVQVALTNLARTREALGITTGTDSALDVAEDPKLPEGPPPSDARAEAESLRTDLRAAQSRVDAADHIVRDSWLDYLPTLLGVAQPFFQNPPTLTQPSTGWQAQLVLTWTVYDGGIRPAQYKERVAGANEARAALDAALRQAHSDVRLSYEELQRADEALVASRRSAQRAKLALELATQAYQAGVTGNLEVIDAERVALDAETTAVVSEDAVRQARLDLLAATGHFPY